jgi:hypothetical protein
MPPVPFSQEKQQVLDMLGFFWTRVFIDKEFVDGYAESISLQLQRLNRFADRLPDYLSRQLVPVTEVSGFRLFIVDETTLDPYAFHYGDEGLEYGGGASYGQLAVNPDQYDYAFDPNFCPNFLGTTLSDSETILTKGEDYEIENGRIILNSSLEAVPGIQKIPRTLPGGEIVYQYLLWGFVVEEDIRAVCDFFGTVAGVCSESTERTKEAVNIAWDMRTEGASKKNLIRMLCLLTHTDYVTQAGTVTDIYLESGRNCVLTDNNVYCAPQAAKVLPHVIPGYAIAEGEVIFDGFSVKGDDEVIDFDDFEGLALGPGYTGDLAPNGLFFANTLVPVTKEKAPGWFDIVELP